MKNMFLKISQTGKPMCRSLFFNTVAGLGMQIYQKYSLEKEFSGKL